MTKSIQILTAFAMLVLLSSFADKDPNGFIGTYGFSAADQSQIKLTINADHTFYYQDFSASEKIVATGNWTLKGKNIVLQDNNATAKFHDVWSFDADGQVAKSRKGLAFYRLCKIG
jgi:hypothetical protein